MSLPKSLSNQSLIDFILVDESTLNREAVVWRDPAGIFNAASPPSKGSRRSSRNQCKQDTSTGKFQAPPIIPPRLESLKDQNDHSAFILPLKLHSPSQSPKVGPAFRVPLNGESIFSLSDLSNSAKEAMQSQGQTLEPTSSLATTSLTSMSNEDDNSVSSLSTPPSSPILEAFSESFPIDSSCIPEYRPSPPKAHCPICKVVVPASLLSAFTQEHTSTTDSDRLNMRDQEFFCRSHRTQTALSTWQSRGYPAIDWVNLHTRLGTHQDVVDNILKGRRESFYRNVLEEKVKSGKTRTVMQELNTLSENAGSNTGYYGSKGAKIM